MFNTECKKTVSKIILSFILIMMTLLSGCHKNTTHSAIEFGTIDVSEIDKIELSGTTGEKMEIIPIHCLIRKRRSSSIC